MVKNKTAQAVIAATSLLAAGYIGGNCFPWTEKQSEATELSVIDEQTDSMTPLSVDPNDIIAKINAHFPNSASLAAGGSPEALPFHVVKLSGGFTGFATKDGKYMAVGQLIDLDTMGDVGSVLLGKEAVKAVEASPLYDRMVYYPEGPTRGVITVFTDVTCPYCTMMHKDIPELNRRGFEVRYLPFPRGMESEQNSPAMLAFASALCTNDPLTLIDEYFEDNSKLPTELEGCEPEKSQVAQSYALGVKLGANGTPAWTIKVGDTEAFSVGYRTPDQIEQFINEINPL